MSVKVLKLEEVKPIKALGGTIKRFFNIETADTKHLTFSVGYISPGEGLRVHLHPDFPKRGFRQIPVNIDRIFICKNDFEKYKGDKVRLIGLFNIKLDKKAEFISKKIIMEMPKIQWVSEKNVKVSVLMSDGSKKISVAEPEVDKLKIDEKIQFVRFGFCRLDKKKPGFFFYFTHK